MVQFFKQLPRELDEAVQMDGCGAWRIYWKIILPLSVPVLATAAIFSFIWTWEDFFGPLIYISDMPSYTVQLGLSSFVDSSGVSGTHCHRGAQTYRRTLQDRRRDTRPHAGRALHRSSGKEPSDHR
jgi:ABC-type glycerol-3-phosphate transport system permease component